MEIGSVTRTHGHLNYFASLEAYALKPAGLVT